MTQFLPTDDAFEEGSPPYGNVGTGFLPLYVHARPTTSAINSIWLPTGFGIGLRPMHAGYSSVNPVLGTYDYCAAFHNNGSGSAAVGAANARQPAGAAFRKPFGADVIVQGIFEMRAVLGTAGLDELAPRGVFARLQGGSLAADGTALPEATNGSCYMAAMYQKQSDSTFRLGIIRFVLGVPTVISESVSIPTSLVNFAALFTITLNVSGTALFATMTSTASSGVVRVPTSGTVPDSDVSGGGRCGFIMGADREPTAGRRQIDLCHMLRVDEGGALKLQDEFLRLSLAASRQTSADSFGVVGSYLTSAFYWDAGTYDGSFSASGKTYTGGRKLLRHATAGRVSFNHATTDDDVNAGRLVLSQRHADSQFSQHRSVKIVIPSAPTAGTGEVWAGIALRARQTQPVDESPPTTAVGGAGPNFPSNAQGYLFVLRARTSTQVTFQLHRINNGAHFAIANLTESGSFSLFPGYGTQFTLDLEVYPRNTADPEGPVELVVKLNGSLIALVRTTPATNAGVLNPSTGVFVDPTSSRITRNFGEGLVVANGFFLGGSASADIDPNFEAWTQGALTNVVVLDQDQASVALAQEPSPGGASLDSIMAPSELVVTHRGFSLSNPRDSGHRQSAPRFRRVVGGDLIERVVYRFTRRSARKAELEALIAHFHERRGLQSAFNFTPPGGTAVPVHYLSDSITYRMVGVDAYDVEFELESLE